MWNRILRHSIYWAGVLGLLTLFFGRSWGSSILAFYFSCMLLPIAIGTTYCFDLYLVPTYLLQGKYRSFILYFVYLLIVSLYLEMLATWVAFIVLANYSIDVMDLTTMSIFNLGINLYLVVFATSFLRLVVLFRKKSQLVASLQAEKKKREQNYLVLRANRRLEQIPFNEILFLESLDDHVRVIAANRIVTSREKISALHKQLPNEFIRIHRSFIVNKTKVHSYSKERVNIQNHSLPISRSFKLEALKHLG